MKIISATIILSTSVSLFAHAGDGELNAINYPYRANLSIRLERPYGLDLNKNIVYPKLQSLLNSYGATIDHQSKINIHEENSYIDFSCFNCVIRNLDNESYNPKPDNGSGTGGIFDL